MKATIYRTISGIETVSFGPVSAAGSTFSCSSRVWDRESWLAIADLIREYFEITKPAAPASSDERHVADIKSYLTGGWRAK